MFNSLRSDSVLECVCLHVLGCYCEHGQYKMKKHTLINQEVLRRICQGLKSICFGTCKSHLTLSHFFEEQNSCYMVYQHLFYLIYSFSIILL